MVNRVAVQVKWVSFLVILLLVTGAMAGCIGGGKKSSKSTKPTSAVPSTAPQPTVNADTCGLIGTVVDDDDLPLAEAKVELVGYARSTKTAQDGSYSFSLLDPRTYQIRVSKTGFRDVTSGSVECKAGEEGQVPLVTLQPVPDANKPSADMGLKDEGRMACTVAQGGAQVGSGQGSVPNIPGCAQGKTSLTVNPKPEQRITGAFFELVWQPATSVTGSSDKLELKLPARSPSADGNYTNETSAGATFNSQTNGLIGNSPLTLKLKLNETTPANATLFLFTPEQNNMTFRVVVPTASAPTVIVDQPFTLWVSLFYNKAPMPACIQRGQEC